MRSLSFRLSLRVFRRHARLAIAAVISLAIGLAAACLGVSASRAVLMKPPVPRPDELLTVYMATPDQPYNEISYPDYRALRDENQVFTGLTAFPFSINMTPLTFEGRDRHGLTNAVSDNYFQVLGVSFLLGRGFAPGDDDRVTRSAVISYGYWQWLGADPHILGKAVTLNNVPLTIVGVTAPGFVGTILTDVPDLWYPLSAVEAFGPAPDWRTRRQDTFYSLIGRLRPGVTAAQALANLRTISAEIAHAHPDTNKTRVTGASPTSMLTPDSVKDAEVLCAVILGVVALVLLAACTNVLNLLLALSSFRRQEFLVRAALGAGRARLVGQLLVDAALLSSAGGLLGFGLASFGLHRLMTFQPYFPGVGLIPITIDFRPTILVGFIMVGLVVAVALALGLVPGIDASRLDIADALRGEVVIGGRRKGRMRNALVAAQLSACTVVLVGVGLCLESLHNLRQVDLGFSPKGVTILTLTDSNIARTADARRALFTRLRDTASRVPGIDAVSLARDLPLDGEPSVQVTIDGGGAPQTASVNQSIVDGAYFAVLHIPVLEGRVFAESDQLTAPEVMILNHTMASRFWPGRDPVGEVVTVGTAHVRVIGVVADSKYSDVDESPTPLFFSALSQHLEPGPYVLARTRGDAHAALAAVAAALGKVDTQVFVMPWSTLEDWTAFAFYVPRLALTCVTGFGLLAVALTAIGLYGAVFYSVSGRTRELGVRVALGAQVWDLAAMILRQAASVSSVGVAVGLAVGVGGTVVVRSWLYGIHAIEWPVLAGVGLSMIALTLLLAYAAARPWLRVDPLRAVRHI